MQTTINPAVLTREQEQANREQLYIDFTTWAEQTYERANAWLDSRSDFYSRIMEQDITWRQSLRAGVVLPILLVLVVGCVSVSPLISLCCIAAAAWVTNRIKQTDAKMNTKSNRRKA